MAQHNIIEYTLNTLVILERFGESVRQFRCKNNKMIHYNYYVRDIIIHADITHSWQYFVLIRE